MIDDRATAEIVDGVAIAGLRDATLTATAAADTEVEARMGAAGGNVTITPAVAIALSTVTATARLGTGSARALRRPFRHGRPERLREGDRRAPGLGRRDRRRRRRARPGDRQPSALAVLERTVDAGGDVTLGARAVSATTGEASASAAGSPEEDPAETPDADGRTGVDRRSAGATTPTASPGPQQLCGRRQGNARRRGLGRLRLGRRRGRDRALLRPRRGRRDDPDDRLRRHGDLRDRPQRRRGEHRRRLGDRRRHRRDRRGRRHQPRPPRQPRRRPETLTVTAHDLVLSATVAVDRADDTATVSATASSGAAGGVSVAGSVALALVDQETLAAIRGTVVLTGGDASLTAASKVAATARALPDGVGDSASGSVGIGVSFAIVLLDDTVTALVDDGDLGLKLRPAPVASAETTATSGPGWARRSPARSPSCPPSRSPSPTR